MNHRGPKQIQTGFTGLDKNREALFCCVVEIRFIPLILSKWLWLFSVFVFPLCLCVSSAAGGSKIQAQKAPKPKEKLPPAERITDTLYRVGKAMVDTAERTVTCRGEINMDNGPIEYLAVAPHGKTHESLLAVEVRPLHLQVALLLLGLEPKNVLKRQGDKATPQGDPVEIRVRWRDTNGNTQDVRAEELVAQMPGSKPMPPHPWVFTGSRILKEGFEADLDKSLVAVWHDPAAILDNPLPGGGNNAYVVNAKRTPRRGTPVEFVLKALTPAPSRQETKSQEPRNSKKAP
ncbi:MAG TPA: YdjY domain-containing protein [Chthonomonadaceae bacterium]|nr:YdjY domain-containing protein [Chthonomonadaceae bacterium]